MNRSHFKWIAIAFLILGVLKFAHSMHWIGARPASYHQHVSSVVSPPWVIER